MSERLDSAGAARRPLGRTVIVAGTAALLIVAAVVWMLRRDKAPETTSGTAAAMNGMAIGGAGSARLTAQQLQQFGVTFGTVEVRMLGAETRATGAVIADETRVAQVAPKFGGFVERLFVDFTGQPVRRGQALMDIYSPELLAAQQELLNARSLQQAVGASAIPGVPAPSVDLAAAARRRLELWDMSAAQIDEVLRSGTPRRAITLYSPASGVVSEKNVVRGQSITAGQTLYTITDLSSVWVEAALRDGDNSAVRVGSEAEVELPSMPERRLSGRVAYIYPTVDAAARTIRARISVPNASGALKPGMFATVRLHTATRSALTVPSSSIVRTGDRAIVFVDMGGGELMPHTVTLGANSGDVTEVLSGVERGARVVTSAQYLIDSESNLADVMRGMVGQGGAGSTADMKGMEMPLAADTGMNAKGASVRGATTPPERR